LINIDYGKIIKGKIMDAVLQEIKREFLDRITGSTGFESGCRALGKRVLAEMSPIDQK
jgi:hypothetical protein